MSFSATKFFRRLVPRGAKAHAAKAPPPSTQRGAARDQPPEVVFLVPWVETPDSTWLARFAFAMRGDKFGLLITFKSDTTIFYPDTTSGQFEALRNAPSRGKWVHNNIYTKPYIEI